MIAASARDAGVATIDIGHSSLKVRAGGAGLELPLERDASHALTKATVERVTAELHRFLAGRRPPARRVACAIPARGVSLRSLTIPSAPREETERLLGLQVEQDYPLPPAALAWGFGIHGTKNGAAEQDVTLIAIRREILADYAALLDGCGLSPSFSVGLLAASRLVRHGGLGVLVDLGRTHSELVLFDGERPLRMRTIPWGSEEITAAIQKGTGASRDEAEATKLAWRGELPLAGTDAPGESDPVGGAIVRGLEPLLRNLRTIIAAEGAAAGEPERPTLFLSGGGSRLAGLEEHLRAALGEICEIARVEVDAAAGSSAVTVGLGLVETQGERNGAARTLRFLPLPAAAGLGALGVRASLVRWGSAALALAGIALALRYLPPVIRVPGLEARIDSARARLAAAPSFERELSFLEELERTQAPALEVFHLLATLAPEGTKIHELGLDPRGNLTLKATAPSTQAANELRRGLEASKGFSQVVRHELLPKDGQFQFRIGAVVSAAELPVAAPAEPPVPAEPTTAEGAQP